VSNNTLYVRHVGLMNSSFYNFFVSSAAFCNQYLIPIGLAQIQWR
jgi:hypothetical protein